VNRDDEFLRNAAQAQQCARRARTDDERANWLLLAEGWLGLLRECQEADEEAFDVAAQKDGQDDSESLH
jgi:hypothetical protein